MTTDSVKRGLRNKVVALGIVGFAIIAAGALGFVRASNSYFLSLKGQHLKYLASSLAAEIGAEEHASIDGPDDMGSESYLRITGLLEEMQRVSGSVVSAYTLRIAGGKVYFIVSPPADYNRDGKISGELEVRDPVGIPYDEPPDEAMEAAAKAGRPGYATDFTTDRWGTVLTGCAPIRFRDGRIEGAVCVDEDAGEVRRDMMKMNWMTAVFALASVLLLLGALAGFLKASVALADRVEAERHRERALRRFESAIENTPMVMVQATDPSGTIHVWNRASHLNYGYSRDEAIGKKIAGLLMEDKEAAKFEQALKKVCDTKRPLPQTECVTRDRKGAVHVVQSSLFPIIEDGEVSEVFCMGVDVTEGKRSREELQMNLDHMKSFYDMMVGRETRMLELKKEVNELCDKLGAERRYLI